MASPVFGGSQEKYLKPGTLYVHPITKSWSEGTALWDSLAADILQPSIGSLPFSGSYYVWYEFDLDVDKISDLTNGLMVSIDANIPDNNSGAALSFNSSEYSYEGYHPKLYIKYQN